MIVPVLVLIHVVLTLQHIMDLVVQCEVELGIVLNTSIHMCITSTQNALSSGHDISRMHAEISDQPSRIINCNNY